VTDTSRCARYRPGNGPIIGDFSEEHAMEQTSKEAQDLTVIEEVKIAEAKLLTDMQDGESGNDDNCQIAEKW
jgi:hypothetical protein